MKAILTAAVLSLAVIGGSAVAAPVPPSPATQGIGSNVHDVRMTRHEMMMHRKMMSRKKMMNRRMMRRSSMPHDMSHRM
jgi:hypothetical protein